MYQRTAERWIRQYLQKNKKILFLWGPRRSGKTTLLQYVSKKLNVPIFNFDFQSDREKFTAQRQSLDFLTKGLKVLLIDEVQAYPESTTILKILVDQYNVQIVATGSSELRKKSQDFNSLAGRYIERYCLPFSLEEIHNNNPVPGHEETAFYASLQNRIQIYGAYPEIWLLSDENQKIELLQTIFDAYVLKDIVTIYNLRNVKLAKDILTKIALQIGQEVSLREIASSLQTNVMTVSNYVEIFIKNYILIPLPAFRTNMRRAVSEHKRYYFFDLGIRNILIKDFRNLDLRQDRGSLFENFIISEIEKRRRNYASLISLYFYREYGGKEVDLVVEDYKKIYRCYEIKYSPHRTSRRVFPIPHSFHPINALNYYTQVQKI